MRLHGYGGFLQNPTSAPTGKASQGFLHCLHLSVLSSKGSVADPTCRNYKNEYKAVMGPWPGLWGLAGSPENPPVINLNTQLPSYARLSDNAHICKILETWKWEPSLGWN